MHATYVQSIMNILYRKIPCTSPGLLLFQKNFLRGGLVLGGNFVGFKKGLSLTIKTT